MSRPPEQSTYGGPSRSSETIVPALEVRGLSVALPQRNKPTRMILRNVSLRLHNGELVVILGKSGAGKTTFLNCIAGFTAPTAGEIIFPPHGDGRYPPFAYVFQEDRLLPWRTAEGNVRLSLERIGVQRQRRRAAALEALAHVGLGEAADLYPWQLSGGMRSRVALARALALRAPLLLLDEPFAKLDPSTRFEMQQLLLKLKLDYRFSALMVTHDVVEAARIGDRAIVLAGAAGATFRDIPIDAENPVMVQELLSSLTE
jgi:NitT/TauT family transport system ATP-binding protein